MRAHALALIHRSYPIARAMEGGPRKKTSGTGQSDPSTLFLESDFNFDGLETQNPNELSDRLGLVYWISTEPHSRARGKLGVVSFH